MLANNCYAPKINPSAFGWYITRKVKGDDSGEHTQYLHEDKIWRTSTCSGPFAYTGYFESENKAKNTLDATCK